MRDFVSFSKFDLQSVLGKVLLCSKIGSVPKHSNQPSIEVLQVQSLIMDEKWMVLLIIKLKLI